VCIGLKWQAETTSQPKISNLDLLGSLINKQVAWLEVPVHDSSLVAVKQALQHLPHNHLNLVYIKLLFLFSQLLKMLLHIHVKELEHQVELVLAVHNVNELHNSFVVKLFKKCNLP
jgi:hypothetical protein